MLFQNVSSVNTFLLLKTLQRFPHSLGVEASILSGFVRPHVILQSPLFDLIYVFLTFSVYSSQTGLLALPWACQAYSDLRAFALALPFAQNALLSDNLHSLFLLFLWVAVKMSFC